MAARRRPACPAEIAHWVGGKSSLGWLVYNRAVASMPFASAEYGLLSPPLPHPDSGLQEGPRQRSAALCNPGFNSAGPMKGRREHGASLPPFRTRALAVFNWFTLNGSSALCCRYRRRRSFQTVANFRVFPSPRPYGVSLAIVLVEA
jgi:hypothetical protein